MDIRGLEGLGDERLYAAFAEAFSDYPVPVFGRIEDFVAANARRGLDLGLSIGAFLGERLVGFILAGSGSRGGEPAAYDMGTGVVPELRGRGIAGRMAEAWKERLSLHHSRYAVLEVLRDNASAYKTYDRAGFRVTRSFECPGGAFADPGKPPPRGLALAPIDRALLPEAARFRDWEPSWQNSDLAVARSVDGPILLGARLEGRLAGRLAGYAVCGTNGSVWQLAVERDSRRKGIGAALLRALAARSSGRLRYVNVQSDDTATLGLLARSGISEGPGQFEMLLDLGPR